MSAASEMDLLVAGEAFALPATTGLVEMMVADYRSTRVRIEAMASLVDDPANESALKFFIEGAGANQGRCLVTPQSLFDAKSAVAVLNGTYWARALQTTNLYECMPQARRDEWNKFIGDRKCPEFTEETLRSTMTDLMSRRMDFIAEKVDGIFRALSHEHVTNRPEGFAKRFIIAGILSYGGPEHTRCGYIHDLRGVVAKFMGRDEPPYGTSNTAVKYARQRRGEWTVLDGGALRLRVYKCGTAHLEVHPDMAWRLNGLLAHLYPQAIPASMRTPPKTKARSFAVLLRPLPFAVVAALGGLPPARVRTGGDGWRESVFRDLPNTRRVQFDDKHLRAEVIRVLEAIGAAHIGGPDYQFDYDPTEVINEVCASGCIPDHKSHQFYPTPPELAAQLWALAEAGPGMSVLEPSAGTGSLADNMTPQAGPCICVELAALNCAVLRAKGYAVVQGDFLQICDQLEPADRVVMNPPFDQGRWKLHLNAAAQCVGVGGRLVAILPAGAVGHALPGFSMSWSNPIHNAFPGASVSVVLLRADRS